MTKHLTQRLIDLRRFGLASQGDSELRFDHRERGFDIRAFVVALHKLFRVVAVQVIHLLPKNGMSFRFGLLLAVALERNEWHGVVVYYCLQIRVRQVGLIRAHFIHNKVLRRCLNQPFELRGVAGISLSHFNGSNNVRSDAAHDVAFDELSLLNQVRICVLRLHPLNKARRRKAGRINAKSDSIACRGRLLSSIKLFKTEHKELPKEQTPVRHRAPERQ